MPATVVKEGRRLSGKSSRAHLADSHASPPLLHNCRMSTAPDRYCAPDPSRRNWIIGAAALLLALLSACTLVGDREFEVSFTTKELQAIIDKAPLAKPHAQGAVEIALARSPVVDIGKPEGRVGVTADLTVQVVGLKPMPAHVVCSFKLVYSEARKAFFLESPQIHALDAPLIPKAMGGLARTAIEHQLSRTLATNPVYTLRDDAPMKEQMARRMLKSIQVRDDRVVATFVPR